MSAVAVESPNAGEHTEKQASDGKMPTPAARYDLSTLLPPVLPGSVPPPVQRWGTHVSIEPVVPQWQPDVPLPMQRTPDLGAQIRAQLGRGERLDPKVQRTLEAGLGTNLSGVRVHTDSTADRLSRLVDAVAFTTGQDIFFRHDAYDPVSPQGLELLAHEATHTVQQRRGPVDGTPTADGVSISDPGDRFERAADATARLAAGQATAIQRSTDLHGPLDRSPRIPAIQRRVEWKNKPKPPETEQFPGVAEDRLIQEKLNALAARAVPRPWPPLSLADVIAGLIRMKHSPLDYGEIDLDDEQHLMLLYHYISKQEGKAPPSPRADRIEEQESAAWSKIVDWELTKEALEQTYKPLYRRAYLGAGATTAYYIASLGHTPEHKESVVIGQLQPWAGQRGPGVLGHPQHMVTMRDFVEGKGQEHSNVWMKREDFSELVGKVFTSSGVTLKQEALADGSAVTREEVTVRSKKVTLYTIALPSGKKIYATEVIVGLGAGPHARRFEEGLKGNIANKDEEIGGTKRIMDMDMFMRVAVRLKKEGQNITVGDPGGSKSDITIILSGGNAAIDAAYEALRLGYKVHWVLGSSGPPILPGFFNYAVILPFLKAFKDRGSYTKPEKEYFQKTFSLPSSTDDTAIKDRINVEIQALEGGRMASLYKEAETTIGGQFSGTAATFARAKFEGVYFGRRGDTKADDKGVSVAAPAALKGDILVFGEGQEGSPIANELITKFNLKEKAKTDENRRFSDKGGAPLGLTSDDGTIKVLGASMRPAHLTKESAEAVSQQTETLPGNMAAHDQLTSIRSAIESMTGFMPTDAGRRIDFTTDDRTMLATHISARFPNLADVLGMRHPGRAEGWTPNTESERREPSYLTRLIECIVKSRRMGVGKDKALAVSPTVKEFQEYWTTQLSELASKQPTEMVTRVEELMQEFKVG